MPRKSSSIKSMTTPKLVANQLREAIKKDGRSLYEVAKLADLSYSMVHGFINNPNKRLHVESAEALARAVGFALEIRKIR